MHTTLSTTTKPRTRWRPASIITAAALLAGAGSPAAQAATAPSPLCTNPSTSNPMKIGVNDARQWWMGSPNLPAGYPVQAHRDLASFDWRNLRAQSLKLRADFILSDIDTNSDGVADSWTFPDALMKTAGQNAVEVLPLLRSNVLPNTPAKRLAFAKIASAIVSRYKIGGTFWAANPNVNQSAISTAEIWNEPNLSSYWGGTQTDYGRLVGQVGYQTQLATPGFRFVSGGMAETSTNGQAPGPWLTGALAHQNEEIPAQANYWFALKGVGLHAYGWPDWSVASAKANYSALDVWERSVGGDRPPIWVTEMGWRYSANPVAGSNTYTDSEIAFRYQTFIQWVRSFYYDCGQIYAYNLRMANSGNALDDGFGFFKTVGTLGGGDTTQRDAGVAPLQAFGVLGQFAAPLPRYA